MIKNAQDSRDHKTVSSLQSSIAKRNLARLEVKFRYDWLVKNAIVDLSICLLRRQKALG